MDPLGRRYHPDTVSDYWAAACAKAGVKRIRLHDARHTCGTLMHLEHNVPVAIISAWLGHADTAFTMRTYVHNQPEKLALAADSISSWTRRKKSAQALPVFSLAAIRADGEMWSRGLTFHRGAVKPTGRHA